MFAFLVGVDGLSDSSLNNRLYIFLKKQKVVFFCDNDDFFPGEKLCNWWGSKEEKVSKKVTTTKGGP